MFELLRIVLAIIPFVALLLLSSKINLSSPKRSRQFILPFVALVYCVIAVLLAERINEWLTFGIAWIGQHVPFVANLNLARWLIYVFNAVIVAVFLIIKGILLPIVNMVWSKERFLFNRTSGRFYEHNERMSTWVLKEEFGQAKTLWKGFFWFGIGISSVVLALSQLYPDWIFFSTPFYPVFGILVMGEILFFLSGLTYQEMLTTIAGDDDEYYRISNYGILRRVFHDLFENRILFDSTTNNLSGVSSFVLLDNLAESENKLDVVISKYFTELKERGHTIDPSFVCSSIDMVNGKSVLINDPFYQDLTGYILLPLVRRLLSYEKVLVIVGRDSAAEDVNTWMHSGIASFCGTPELWKTAILTEKKAECDVAILRFADVYNRNILNANTEFLNQVGFVLLIEPSRTVSTGQIGLSLIVEQVIKGKDPRNVVYCSCDRNCDGLVDTLSHILKVNLTEVCATAPTLANCSLMYWNAHGDFLHHKILPNIAHYLGVGTELSSVALRNQIAKTIWVGSEQFPVLDMRWIAGQYYNVISNYIGYPKSQEAFYEAFNVDANLWDLGVMGNTFLIVEDEFNNLFEMTRLYSTRAKNQGFLNVISKNYLLRDYMVDNASIFAADSKVIPSIVSDYTRTERNTIVGLIMRMHGGEVSETDLKRTLSLAGIEFINAYDKFRELVINHCHLDAVNVSSFLKDEIAGDDMRVEPLRYYTIRENNTKLSEYARTLSNAYFIIEDDKDKDHYLGAMLYGQVFQKFLPGQFLTYSGKYYQVHTITPERGVVLRRAADHITDRRTYRQRREYILSGFSSDPAMGSRWTSRGIELCRCFCNFKVKTHGYYELTSLDNFAAAHRVDLNNIPIREYKHKSMLCLKLSGVSEDVHFTVALLLNEIFITIFPESYHYITATVKKHHDTTSSIMALLSDLDLSDSWDEEAIYIIEDSEVDLGLLVSVERNLARLLEIIADWLAWQKPEFTETEDTVNTIDAMKTYTEVNGVTESEAEPDMADNSTHEDIAVAEETSEPSDEIETETEPDVPDDASVGELTDVTEGEDIAIAEEVYETGDEIDNTESEGMADAPVNVPDQIEDNDNIGSDKVNDVSANESIEDDHAENESATESDKMDTTSITRHTTIGSISSALPSTQSKKKYSEKQYIFYGYEQVDPMLNIKDTLSFLESYCYDKNALQQARINSNIATRMEDEFRFDKPDAHFCDFCATELSGGEYDILADGRERCIQCANSALKTVEQFTRLYENALRNMETFFGIRINVPIKVRLASAKKIAKLCGLKFVPSPGYTGRVLAFAQKDSNGYTIYVENGSPKIAAVANIVHELTHIWQFVNWDKKKIISYYGKENELLVYEGMAKWTEIQYLLFLNEVSYAKRQEIFTKGRNDAYGQGFIKYAEQYPLVYGPGYRKTSPFNKEWPLEKEVFT